MSCDTEAFNFFAGIKSIQLTTNIDFLDLAIDPINGSDITLSITAGTVAAHKFFGTSGAGVPEMRSITRDDLPFDIDMAQVDGLDDALEALVKTLTSGNSYILVSGNPQGDHSVTLNVGTTSGSVAAGNDTRFPASVAGLRKGAGVGGLDTAAVANTDYWDTDVFIASGAGHKIGLVPTPGASAGTTRYLREDASWQTPSGAGTVSSVGLVMPSSEFTVSNSPITSAGDITITRVVQVARKIFAGPISGADAVPAFRFLTYQDIPTGTTGTTIAIGNDTRFPASVTGIRKGAGVGSLDTAAVANTDYWDTDVFGPSGLSHAIGLVPDPGAVSGVSKFLCEDATWKGFTVAAGSVTNTMLAQMQARRIKGNPTGSTNTPQDVTATIARTPELLNLESRTSFGDADYTALATDKYVYSTAVSLTADRRVTLPAANGVNEGQILYVGDDTGSIQTFNLKVKPAGADTINGLTADMLLKARYSAVALASNGTNGWNVLARSPGVNVTFLTSNGTYTKPTGCKALFVEAIGGGGGGAGAVASASNSSAGGGGAGGGYASKLILSPSSSYSYTIGPGGGGGSSAGAPGSAGGTTAFGSSLVSASGGGGGSIMSSGTSLNIGNNLAVGGIMTFGDFGITGYDGENPIRLSGTVGNSSSGMPAGAYSSSVKGTTVEGIGTAGVSYGGGGSGALSNSASGFAGGAGRQGVIRVWEFY